MHLLFQGVPIALVFSTLCAIIVKSVPHGGGHEPIYDPSSQNNEQNSNTGVGLIGSSHIDTMPLIAGTQNMDIRMPGAAPTRNDHYMCTAKKLPNQKIYLVGFEALSSASIAHHILLFGCDVPASNNEIWDCGLVCGGTNQRIIFAWAKNADPIHMPIDVGFEVGPQIKTSYLVMQIHYKHPHKAGEPLDTSGLRLSATTESQMYLAGIYLLLGMESVPADKQIFNVDVSCPYNGEAKLYPFAFRTHAHDLARVVSGYKYNGTWTELARGNPQWPQAFYPVTHNLSVSNGEYLFSRCSYNSSQRHRTTYMGSTGSDEMCNLYIMYYTDATRGESYYSCGHKNQLDNIPADADVMLPPNPLLDEAAKGEGHHHSHGIGGSGGQEPSQNPPTRPPTQHPTQDPGQYNVQYADLESQNDAIVDFRMPGANPTRHDHYMCTAMKVPKGTSYLVAFEAIATAKIAHHILLFGCEVPANRAPIWDCGMVCGTRKQRVVFAWAKNAPPFEVPKDVGFKVGTDEHTDYLVMQIHYVHKHADGTPLDISGLKIHFTRERQKFIAGIYLLMSGESIPGDTPTYNTDVSCRYAGPTQIFPFAFRTHAHVLGKVVSGYKYNGTWYELARGNPQWPQSFYAVSHKLTINPGDYLFARCTYNSSNRHRITHMGSTGEDEMCNLYLMYYTDAIRGKSYGLCTARNTLANIPAGSDTTLPPNSVLDSVASGHASMGGGHSDHAQAGKDVDVQLADASVDSAAGGGDGFINHAHNNNNNNNHKILPLNSLPRKQNNMDISHMVNEILAASARSHDDPHSPLTSDLADYLTDDKEENLFIPYEDYRDGADDLHISKKLPMPLSMQRRHGGFYYDPNKEPPAKNRNRNKAFQAVSKTRQRTQDDDDDNDDDYDGPQKPLNSLKSRPHRPQSHRSQSISHQPIRNQAARTDDRQIPKQQPSRKLPAKSNNGRFHKTVGKKVLHKSSSHRASNVPSKPVNKSVKVAAAASGKSSAVKDNLKGVPTTTVET